MEEGCMGRGQGCKIVRNGAHQARLPLSLTLFRSVFC